MQLLTTLIAGAPSAAGALAGLRAHGEWRGGVVTPFRETSAAGGPKDSVWSAFPIELGSIP